MKITFPFQKNKIKLKKEEEGGGGILFAVGDKKEKREGFGLDISNYNSKGRGNVGPNCSDRYRTWAPPPQPRT